MNDEYDSADDVPEQFVDISVLVEQTERLVAALTMICEASKGVG